MDDGLGVALSEMVDKLELSGVTSDSNYQLNAEDALEISDKDIVIFADASQNDVEPFRLTTLQPAADIAFTTHAMSPGSVLALCHELYKKKPRTYLLEIKGYEWELREEMTDKAKDNLEKAFDFIQKLLENPSEEAFQSVLQ